MNKIEKIALLIIPAFIVAMTFFIPGNAAYEAPDNNKYSAMITGAIAMIAYFGGSKWFAPKKKEAFWKVGYWVWVAVVVASATATFSLLVLHGGPLGLNGKTV